MSVLIKDMKMPSRCYGCPFSAWSNLHQTLTCTRYNFKPCFEDNSREYFKKRADFCPIVEVPTPHGDLIDKSQIKVVELEDSLYFMRWERGTEIDFRIEASTVIEAEDGDTK